MCGNCNEEEAWEFPEFRAHIARLRALDVSKANALDEMAKLNQELGLYDEQEKDKD